MKPMTVYTDNVGGESGNAEHVFATVDYLPLLGEYEIFGTIPWANSYEQNKQAQYEYFANNSTARYNHSSTGSAVSWWERSPRYESIPSFCRVAGNGGAGTYVANNSRGLAPIFKV